MMFRGITVNCLQLRFYPLLHCIPFYNKYRGVLKIVQVRAKVVTTDINSFQVFISSADFTFVSLTIPSLVKRH